MACPSGGASGSPALTVAEVHASYQQNEFGNSGPIKLHVVNYEAPNEYPYKFTYPGCTGISEDGRMCRRSMRHYRCRQHADELGFADMLRFDVMVCDGSEFGKPFKVTIFSPLADTFLELSAMQMAALNEVDQISHVERKIRAYPMLEVRLNVSQRGVVLQSMNRCLTPRLPPPRGPCLIASGKKPTKAITKVDVENETILQEATKLLRKLRFGSSVEDE